jgi:hypothetical protein
MCTCDEVLGEILAELKALSGRPIVVQLDGTEVLRTVEAAAEKAKRR